MGGPGDYPNQSLHAKQVIIRPKQFNSRLDPEKVVSVTVCQENGRLGQVGTVVALGPPECPVGACKVIGM